jgi:hypothetical protein
MIEYEEEMETKNRNISLRFGWLLRCWFGVDPSGILYQVAFQLIYMQKIR